ncbi:DUF4062 domain-containing protein [Sphingobacterium lactis]|uniref:DUF4062 domain-containing protein n=1 Tax=Sphingobacterium lactis TaxID=797291 RepID=UPI003EC80F23
MRDTRYQVFISSTFKDLQDERQAAVMAILNSYNIPAGMELFTANNLSQWEIIKSWIDLSDIYVLILGGRYGSIDKASGKSYTHLEFEYAKTLKKPMLALVLTEKRLIEIKSTNPEFIENDNPKLLTKFRSQVEKGLVGYINDVKDIQIEIAKGLRELLDNNDLVGWVRSNNTPSLHVTEELARLSEENHRLKALITKPSINGMPIDEFKKIMAKRTENYKSAISIYLKYGKRLNSGVSTSSQLRNGTPLWDFFILYEELGLIKRENPMRPSFKFTDAGHFFYMQLLNELE